MPEKSRNIRFIEVSTGLLLLLSIISMIVSFLMNFNYTLPYSTFEEDLAFIIDSIPRHNLSAICWIISGSIYLFFIPFYLMVFFQYQKGMHILSSLFLLTIAYMFFRTGITELNISKLVISIPNTDNDIHMVSDSILSLIRESGFLLKIGISALGGFSMVFSISKFGNVRFPLIGSTLTFIAGPVILSFVWINFDHIILTTAIVTACIGLMIIGVMLVNKGMEKSV